MIFRVFFARHCTPSVHHAAVSACLIAQTARPECWPESSVLWVLPPAASQPSAGPSIFSGPAGCIGGIGRLSRPLWLCAGPTGLDMLAASYDTDQASDPPTPCAEAQPPSATAGADALSDAVEDAAASAAAASTADGSSEAAEADVAAAAPEAARAAVEAQPEMSGPQGHPGVPAAAVASPLAAALPAATQAIMNKLIGFVKVRQVPAPSLIDPESFYQNVQHVCDLPWYDDSCANCCT